MINNSLTCVSPDGLSMTGELKFLSQLSKKEDDTADTAASDENEDDTDTPDEKEVLHLPKNQAKKNFSIYPKGPPTQTCQIPL